MKTVLITGSSTGIGRAAALEFQRHGWNVVATMRTPSNETELTRLPNVLVTALDVTDEASIRQAVDEAIARFGHLDVVVNNAGYGLSGVFEGYTEQQIRRQFETNVFGLMAVVRAVLPHFRSRRQGTIVNISSMGGRLTFPFYSAYHGTKWAVEGFSESLQYELQPLGIRVKLVEPGAIRTDFYDRSADLSAMNAHPDYAPHTLGALALMNQTGASAITPDKVAQVIHQAASAADWRLRYPVGPDSGLFLTLRRLLPGSWFRAMIRFGVLDRGRKMAPTGKATTTTGRA